MPDVHVLVVDDEPDIRATVSAMLEIEGYAVTEAANEVSKMTLAPCGVAWNSGMISSYASRGVE